MACVAVGALTLNAPAALADDAKADCRLRSVQQDDVTGQSFQGVLAGYAVHEGNVSVNCVIEVNGVAQAQSGVGVGTGVATTAKDISFTANDTDVVRLCVWWQTDHSQGYVCITLGIIQIPPQVVYDTIDSVLAEVWKTVDPPTCAELKKYAGTYGGPPPVPVIVITADGDVYVDGELWWDCPPYGS